MPEQPTYPQFVYDPRTRILLRCNSLELVFLTWETRLYAHNLREPRLLHSVGAALMTAAQVKPAQAG